MLRLRRAQLLPGADPRTFTAPNLQYLMDSPTDFSILYLGSTWLPRDLGPLLTFSRRRGIPVVVNQDGVGYPGWAGDGTDAFNRPLRRALQRGGDTALSGTRKSLQ